MTHAGNVSGDLVAIGQTHTGDLTPSGVRLLGGSSSHGGADATLLRSGKVGFLVLQCVQALLHSGGIGLASSLLSALLDQLIKGRRALFLLSIEWFREKVSLYFPRNKGFLFRMEQITVV